MPGPNELIQAFKLYEKTSKNGNIYFVGRFGGLKVVVMRNDREKGNSGETVWNVMFGEAPPAPKRDDEGYRPNKPRVPTQNAERERDPNDPSLAF